MAETSPASAPPPDRRQGFDVGAGPVKEGDRATYDGRECKVLTVYHDGDVQIEIPTYKTVKWRFVTPNTALAAQPPEPVPLHGPHDYAGTPRCQNCGVEYDPLTTPTWCDKYPGDAERPPDFAPADDPVATQALLLRSIRSQSDLIVRLTNEREATQSALAESRADVERLHEHYTELVNAARGLRFYVKLDEALKKLDPMYPQAVAATSLRSPTATGEDRTKEQLHRLFYDAFHAWFMSEDNGCDFWSECDAPEALATVAVELADRESAAARARGVREGYKKGRQEAHPEAVTQGRAMERERIIGLAINAARRYGSVFADELRVLAAPEPQEPKP